VRLAIKPVIKHKVKHTSNQPLDEDLEDSRDNQRVQQTNGCVVDIPERADSDLADKENGKGDEERHESSSPDGDNLVAKGVSELRVDDFSIAESD
jgi:hypothetical protein